MVLPGPFVLGHRVLCLKPLSNANRMLFSMWSIAGEHISHFGLCTVQWNHDYHINDNYAKGLRDLM